MAPVVEVKEKLKNAPNVDRYTGVCSVCGTKDGHGWKCIIWFIQNSVSFYRRHLVDVKELLVKIKEGRRHVSSAEIEEHIAKLEYIKQLVDDL